MKKALITLWLALILIVQGYSQLRQQVELLDGKTTEISSLQGSSLTLIDFWATWCQPCLKSIPEFIDIQENFQDKGVQVLGVNIDGPRNLSKVKPFVLAKGINYPIILDTDKNLMRDFNVAAVPTLIIVNSTGDIVYLHEGFQKGDGHVIREELTKLLGHE